MEARFRIRRDNPPIFPYTPGFFRDSRFQAHSNESVLFQSGNPDTYRASVHCFPWVARAPPERIPLCCSSRMWGLYVAPMYVRFPQ